MPPHSPKLPEEPYHPPRKRQDQVSSAPSAAAILLGLLIALALLFLLLPMAFTSKKNAPMVTAVSNGKEIGKALICFEQDYGSFPDARTARLLQEQHPEARLAGPHANDYLRQLILSEIIDTESVFYSKIGKGIRQADHRIHNNLAVDAHENAWTYTLKRDGSGLTTKSSSQVPVLMTPVTQHQGLVRFDAEPFQDRAVVIRMNNAAETLVVFPDGTVDTADTQHLFPSSDQNTDQPTGSDLWLVPPEL